MNFSTSTRSPPHSIEGLVIEPAFAAIRANGFAGLPFVLDADDDERLAARADDLTVPAQKRRRHRAGGNDVSFCRESSHQEHAQTEHHDQLDRLAHPARSTILEPAASTRCCASRGELILDLIRF